MIGYFSRTSSGANLDVLRPAGFRMLVTPDTGAKVYGFGYAIDNAVWGARQRGVEWDGARFQRFVERHGAAADFVVAPDVVAGGWRSLDQSVAWLRALRGVCRLVLIPVQDGCVPSDLELFVQSGLGIFLGGSTGWKEATMIAWGRWARARGLYFHVGRVNSLRRLRLVYAAGAQSFDGSGPSRFTHMARRMVRGCAALDAQAELIG